MEAQRVTLSSGVHLDLDGTGYVMWSGSAQLLRTALSLPYNGDVSVVVSE